MFLAPVPPTFLSREDAGAGLLRPGRRGQHLSQWTCCPPLAQVSKKSTNISFERQYENISIDMEIFG